MESRTRLALNLYGRTVRMNQSYRDVLWRFARGDAQPTEFESWLYANHEEEELAQILGADLLLELVSVRYSDPQAMERVRRRLGRYLADSGSSKCRCSSWRDLTVLPLGYDPIENRAALIDDYFDYTVVSRRTPWLECVRCRVCGQAWYVATDTVGDQYRLLRLDDAEVEQILDDVWPTVFDDWDDVWPDQEWITGSGYTSLEAWLEQHPPDPPDPESR